MYVVIEILFEITIICIDSMEFSENRQDPMIFCDDLMTFNP